MVPLSMFIVYTNNVTLHNHPIRYLKISMFMFVSSLRERQSSRKQVIDFQGIFHLTIAIYDKTTLWYDILMKSRKTGRVVPIFKKNMYDHYEAEKSPVPS